MQEILTDLCHREKGQWAIYYTSPQSYKTSFHIRWLNNFVTFVNFDWLFNQVECLNVSTTNY